MSQPMVLFKCCRLVEDADLRAAQELFGSGGDMQQQKLKTLREHENYGRVSRLQTFLHYHLAQMTHWCSHAYSLTNLQQLHDLCA